MIRCLKMSLLGAVVASTMSGGAQAQVIYGDAGSTYGYAGPAIRGDYVGAPFTRFPRPDQLVPSAWGYGTYGVPTVSGIAPAPVGTPTVYVIEAPAPVIRKKAARSSAVARPRANTLSQAPAIAPDGPRIISVRVPSRQASLR